MGSSSTRNFKSKSIPSIWIQVQVDFQNEWLFEAKISVRKKKNSSTIVQSTIHREAYFQFIFVQIDNESLPRVRILMKVSFQLTEFYAKFRFYLSEISIVNVYSRCIQSHRWNTCITILLPYCLIQNRIEERVAVPVDKRCRLAADVFRWWLVRKRVLLEKPGGKRKQARLGTCKPLQNNNPPPQIRPRCR